MRNRNNGRQPLPFIASSHAKIKKRNSIAAICASLLAAPDAHASIDLIAIGSWSGTFSDRVGAGDDKFYVFAVSDANLTNVGAVYMAQSISPVPEPETYALMLAGLALVGGIARQREIRRKIDLLPSFRNAKTSARRGGYCFAEPAAYAGNIKRRRASSSFVKWRCMIYPCACSFGPALQHFPAGNRGYHRGETRSRSCPT